MPQRRSSKGRGMVALLGKSGVLQSRIKELERALQERPPVQPNPPRTTSPPRAAAEGRSPPGCYKCREVGHYRRNCPRNSGTKATRNTGGDGGGLQRSRGPSPQTKGADGQRPGTGDRAPRGPRTVRVLTPERNELTAYHQDPMVFAPICPDRESDPPDSDSAGTPASSAPPSCLGGRRKRRRSKVRFQAPPSP